MRLGRRKGKVAHNRDPFLQPERWRAAVESLNPRDRLVRASGFLGLYGQIAARLPGHGSIVQFIGAEGGEGTSALAWEFAYTVATVSGRSVLLLHDSEDGLCRLATWGKLLEANAAADERPRALLEGERNGHQTELCMRPDTTSLAPARPVEVIESSDTDGALGGLRVEFELIVIDSAPLTCATESVLVSRKADGVVLVIRADSTSAMATEAAKRALEGAGAKLLGVLFNTGLA